MTYNEYTRAEEAISRLPGGAARIWEIINERRGDAPTPPDADYDDLWNAEDRERIIREDRAHRRREALTKGTCPTCNEPGALTRYEARKGYQCSTCTARDEGCGF